MMPTTSIAAIEIELPPKDIVWTMIPGIRKST
jgi:hypothetical protein